MAEKPRLLVIERESRPGPSARDDLADRFDVVVARSIARAIVLLRQQQFVGVFVDSAQLSAVRWASVLIQADEILDAIADGVAVLDPDLKILWANPEFQKLTDAKLDSAEARFYSALGSPEVLGPIPARSPRPSRRRARPRPCFGSGRIAT